MRHISLILLLFICAAVIPSALAKGVMSIEIVAPNSDEVCTRKSADTFLGVWTNGNIGTLLSPLAPDSDFYEIRLLVGHEDQVFAKDIFHYYPDKAGFIYYADVEGGSSTAEGQWFTIDGVRDSQLRDLLESPCIQTYNTLDYLLLGDTHL